MDNKDKKNDKPKISLMKIIVFASKTVMATMPGLFILINIIAVFHGSIHGFATLMTQRFYDSVEGVITGSQNMRNAYFMIFGLGFTYIAKEMLNGIHNFMHDVVFQKANGEMAKLIHMKMARIDPICLEDTTLHDDINKAQEGAGTVIFVLAIGITIFTFYIPYFIFMAVYLYYLKPQFILAIVFVFLPVMVGQLLRTKIVAKFEDKAAPIRRENSFYENAIVGKEFFKETRILGAYRLFIKRFLNSLKNLNKAEWEANKKTNLIELGMRMFTVAGYAGILYMLVSALLAGEITVGAFAAVFGSIGMLFGVMEEVIARHIGSIASSLGKAHNFIRFMELPERGGDEGEPDFTEGIVAENVSFKYPNAEHNSIDHVDFIVRQGETVAIVGENGAGKTTFVRLIMGLYKPSDGKVLVNGLDTKRFSMSSLFHGVSGVFQKFQRYQITLGDNIHISECNNEHPVDAAARQAGINAEDKSFPDGYSTMLSREFDGVDLSGGQWQRIAIARGLYRVHDMIILDEPTAAIDPLEESRIYKKFIEISKNKTAIIVTHRLGAAKIADRIIVMEKGRIVGAGTHDELIKDCELYNVMFTAQSEWYQEQA